MLHRKGYLAIFVCSTLFLFFTRPFVSPPANITDAELGRNDQILTSGKGIDVAVLDVFSHEDQTPLEKKSVKDWAHVSFPEIITPDDPTYHGRHVSDIVSILAPEATVLRLSIGLSPLDFKLMVSHKDIKIINASAFKGGDWIVRDIGQALETGKILVLAAGNNGSNLSSGFHPFAHILIRLEDMNPAYMQQVVLALNLQRPDLTLAETLLSWMTGQHRAPTRLHRSSNFPGSLYAHMSVAAPGENVGNLASPPERMTGTSSSAPVISGVLANFSEYAERLSPLSKEASSAEKRQRARLLVSCLFDGARKFDEKGHPLNPALFGQGAVNWSEGLQCLRRALAP